MANESEPEPDAEAGSGEPEVSAEEVRDLLLDEEEPLNVAAISERLEIPAEDVEEPLHLLTQSGVVERRPRRPAKGGDVWALKNHPQLRIRTADEVAGESPLTQRANLRGEPRDDEVAIEDVLELLAKYEERRGDLITARIAANLQITARRARDLADVQENRGGESHAQLMRDAYDELLDYDLRFNIHRQDGEDMPDATAIPDLAEYRDLRSDPTLEPAEVASRVATIREEHEMVAKLSDVRPISVEAESTKGTGGTAPAQTLINLAAALGDGRRCLLLARGETAEDIRARIEDAPALMRSTAEDGVARLYNRNRDLRIAGETVYRRSGGESKWLYHQRTGTFELVGTDGTIATFDDAEAISEDANAYPRTESEIGDGDGWSTVKAPFVPSLEFDGVEMGDAPDPTAYDVIRVPASSEDGGLEVVEATGAVPLADLFDPPTADDGETEESGGMISLR